MKTDEVKNDVNNYGFKIGNVTFLGKVDIKDFMNKEFITYLEIDKNKKI